ncbi:MAG: hypothetical protein VX834_09545, partial [Myxococcota bacterium]|nr:hypothetical protein [Myxococcota bacterium]
MRAPKLHISLALALLAAASACAGGTESHETTDEPATQDDHADDSQGSSQNETVQLPAAPAQPDFAEWLPEACGPSERAIIGGSCQAVGRACPPNGWPEAPAGVTNLRYVKPDATGSGLSAEEPSGSIQAMLDSLTTGAVLLHTGTYQESLTVSSAVEVVGACAEATTIRSSSRSITSGTVELTGSARGLSNVTVTGPRPGVWIWSHQGAVSVRGVVVANAEYVGLSMTNDNKNITIEDVLIRDTRVSANDEGGYGWGMEVFGSNSVTLRGVGLRGNLDAGLYADGNTIEISAEDLAIYQTQPNPVTDSGGWGMALFSGVNMALRRGFFYQNRGMNTLVQGDNATLEAQDLVIRETLPDASDDSWGHALEAREAGHIEVTRGYIVENRDVAIAIMNDNSTGNFTDLTVGQTRHQVSDTQGGWGLLVSLGAQVILERAHFDDNQDAGVLIDQTGSYLRATDLSITHTVESPSGIGGWGLGVQFGASADLNRVHIDRSREVGMVLFDTGTV